MEMAERTFRVLKALRRRATDIGNDVNRKEKIRSHVDRVSYDIDRWMDRNQYFHQADQDYMRFLIPEGQRVLELGCGTGACGACTVVVARRNLPLREVS